jgi:hypothetical protein
MTRRTLCRAAGAAAWLLSLVAAEAQTPRDQGAPRQPAGTALVSGTVVSGDEQAARLRQAHVVIVGAATGVLRVTSTDRDGRFSFANLPADRYVVGASKPPFLGTVAGARRPGHAGTAIVVAEGQRIENVSIRLPPGAVITGVVTDERGQPAQHVTISLLQPRMQNGERTLSPASAGAFSTDDRGRYRVHGLAPGEYIVVAAPRVVSGVAGDVRVLTDAEVDNALKAPRPAPSISMPAPQTAAPSPSPSPAATSYAPVFYPGTTRPGDASPIVLGGGEERRNVDFRLELVRSARLDGTIVVADGQLPPSVTVSLVPADALVMPGRTFGTRVMADGRFSLLGVPPGAYTLLARSNRPAGALFAAAPIEMAGVDQSGVQLQLRPALSFEARVVFEGGTTPPPSTGGIRVAVRALTPGSDGAAAPQVGPTSSAGTFSVTGLVPGRYVIGGQTFFGASLDSVTWALQSVRVDGRDVTDLPIDIAADAMPKDVVVTFGDRAQELSGRLLDASGAAAPGYTIVVFPADRAFWLPHSRRILTARPGTDGRFRVGGPGPVALPPGVYLIAAATDVGRDEQFDPSFLATLVPAAVPITIQAGESKVQDLVIK